MSNLKCRSLALAAVCALSIPGAWSNPITFTPNGDSNAGNLKCDVAINSLGSLALKGGSANISGKVITIKAGSAFIDTPRTVLIGSVLRTESSLTSDPPHITGLALFLMGDWQDQIDDGTSKDMIFRKDGRLEGRILGIENESLSVNVNGVPQHIPLASVLYIRSPRVFVFKIALKSRQPLSRDTVIQAESADASFRPTATARTLSGSVIPAGDRKDDGMGASMGGLPGAGAPDKALGGMGGLNPFSRSRTASPGSGGDDFDDPDDANRRFSTIHTRFGDQKLTLPPGMME